MNNIEKGKLGEEIAAKYIVSKGGKIIERNYKIKIGEVDLIVLINGELVFVEVKSRSNINYGYPSEAVNYKKKQKITNVAKYYILNNCLDNISIRFDVIEVYLKSKKDPIKYTGDRIDVLDFEMDNVKYKQIRSFRKGFSKSELIMSDLIVKIKKV